MNSTLKPSPDWSLVWCVGGAAADASRLAACSLRHHTVAALADQHPNGYGKILPVEHEVFRRACQLLDGPMSKLDGYLASPSNRSQAAGGGGCGGFRSFEINITAYA